MSWATHPRQSVTDAIRSLRSSRRAVALRPVDAGSGLSRLASDSTHAGRSLPLRADAVHHGLAPLASRCAVRSSLLWRRIEHKVASLLWRAGAVVQWVDLGDCPVGCVERPRVVLSGREMTAAAADARTYRFARAGTAVAAAICVFCICMAAPGVATADEADIAVSYHTVISGTFTWEIRLLKADGSLVRTLSTNGSASSISWSPDNGTLRYIDNSGWVTQPVAGGSETKTNRLQHYFGDPAERAGLSSVWSPTSDEIAYWTYKGSITGTTSSTAWTLWAISPDDVTRRIIAGPFVVNGLRQPSGDPVPGSSSGIEPGGRDITWSRDGQKLAFLLDTVDQDKVVRSDLVEVPAAGGGPTPIASTDDSVYQFLSPQYSPDGKRIAFLKVPSNSIGTETLVARDLGSGAETTLASSTAAAGLGLPSWSPDSRRIAYVQSGVPPDPASYYLLTTNADGSGGTTTLLTAPNSPASPSDQQFIDDVAWANQPDPKVLIDTPAPGQEITGEESTPAEQDAVRLTGTVTSAKALSGWCFAIQAPTAPVPATPSKTDCNRPFDLTVMTGGRTGGSFRTDIATLVGTDLKPGENTVWVWGYDASSIPGVARVTVNVAPNLYAQWIEVAQPLSYDLSGLNTLAQGVDPKNPQVNTLTDSRSFFLVEDKPTVVRVYVQNDVKTSTPTKQNVSIELHAYRNGVELPDSPQTGTGSTVTGGVDLGARQQETDGSLSVIMPVSWRKGVIDLEAFVNADHATRECTGCFPNGNRLRLRDVKFRDSGSLTIRPYRLVIATDGPAKAVSPPNDLRTTMWTDALPAIPVSPLKLKIDPWVATITLDRSDLVWVRAARAAGVPEPVCGVMLRKLLTAVALAGPTTSPGITRAVGVFSKDATVSLPAGRRPDCAGGSKIAGDPSNRPGDVDGFIASDATPLTAVHELGHSFGMQHRLSAPGDRVGAGATSLPYDHLGAVGYEVLSNSMRLISSDAWDLMSYAELRWPSLVSWTQMADVLRSGISPAANTAARASAAATAHSTSAATAPATIVSGFLAGGRAIDVTAVRAAAASTTSAGAKQALGSITARDARGKIIATTRLPIVEEDPGPSARVTAITPAEPSAGPFVAVLHGPAPAKISIADAKGHQVMRLTRSPHAPTGRFTHLPAKRRVKRSKTLVLRWSAADRDRGTRLTYTILATTDRTRQPLALTAGQHARSLRINPAQFARAHKLKLRLLISDGLNTTTANSPTLSLRN
jgi:WD40-like Beta Propeller Repeat